MQLLRDIPAQMTPVSPFGEREGREAAQVVAGTPVIQLSFLPPDLWGLFLLLPTDTKSATIQLQKWHH
jgi:hypothetical protein